MSSQFFVDQAIKICRQDFRGLIQVQTRKRAIGAIEKAGAIYVDEGWDMAAQIQGCMDLDRSLGFP
ncbi:MAG: hypothetical protein M0T73_01390 [Deltaproteobacteria bacterium]|nr:hypothetical protein [Deltaproteobacteria bacterium]